MSRRDQERLDQEREEQLYLHLLLQGRRYALPIHNLLEILPTTPLTPLPDAPPELLGAIEVRGDFVPVMDLQYLLDKTYTDAPAQILLLQRGEERYGLAITHTLYIAAHDQDEIQPCGQAHHHPLLRGMIRHGEQAVLLLAQPEQLADADRLTNAPPPDEPPTEHHELDSWLSFLLHDIRLGLPLAQVSEVLEHPAVTAVPLSQPAVLGVFNLRGNVVPVVELAQLLGLPPGRPWRHVIMTEHARPGGTALIGLAVDQVQTVVEADDEVNLPTAFLGPLAGSPCVRSVLPQPDAQDVLLLHIHHLFAFPEPHADA